MIFGGGVGSEPSPPKVLFTLLRITVARLISLLQNGATHTRNNYCICYFDWFQTHKPTSQSTIVNNYLLISGILANNRGRLKQPMQAYFRLRLFFCLLLMWIGSTNALLINLTCRCRNISPPCYAFFKSRLSCLLISRFFMVSFLSYSFLPLPMPKSSFALPRTKYTLSGTSAYPFSLVRFSSFAI